MRARIDIGEVESRTKIRAKYLRAIENEEWDLLPGPVYVKSFLRTYGDYLGLDSRMLIDEYKRRYERPGEGELRPIAPLGRERERERRTRGLRPPPWLIVVVVLVIVVVLLAIVGQNNGDKGPAPVTGLKGHGARHTATHHPAAPAKHKRVVHRPTTVKVQITPTAAVYICAANSTGKVLIPGITYEPGQTVPVLSAAKLLITLGNNAVTMKVNGHVQTIPASSTAIGLELTPQGQKPLAPAQQPTCT